MDTGVNPHTTDRAGQTWTNPRAYYRAERKPRRWQRVPAGRIPHSRSWWKAQRRIAVVNRRVPGMMHGKTPKAQADGGMGEIKRQLSYKGRWRHCNVALANRCYSSSKTCSNGQAVNVKLKREPF